MGKLLSGGEWAQRAGKAFEVYLERCRAAKERFDAGALDEALDELHRAKAAFANFRYFLSQSETVPGDQAAEGAWSDSCLAEAAALQDELQAAMENHRRRCMAELADCVKIKAGISKFKSRERSTKAAINVSA